MVSLLVHNLTAASYETVTIQIGALIEDSLVSMHHLGVSALTCHSILRHLLGHLVRRWALLLRVEGAVGLRHHGGLLLSLLVESVIGHCEVA